MATYNPETGEYTIDGETLSQEELAAFMADIRLTDNVEIDALAEDYSEGRITESQWFEGMQKILKKQAVVQYAAGAGGAKALKKRDYGIIGRFLKDQYAFLRGFRDELGTLSLKKIQARAKLYLKSMRVIFERAKSEVRGLGKLPFYPGSGAQPCRANCLCHLEYRKEDGRWVVYWRLGGNENHCTECPDVAKEWNPYTPNL